MIHREQARKIRMWIEVQTGKKVNEVTTGRSPGELLVRVKQPPKEGKANKAVRDVVAGHFGTAPSSVEIIKGFKSKRKLIEVELRIVPADSQHGNKTQCGCGREIDSFPCAERSSRIGEVVR